MSNKFQPEILHEGTHLRFLKPGRWEYVGRVEASRVAGGKIQVHEVPLARMGAWRKRKTAAGAMIDPKVFAGCYCAQR